MRQSNPLNETNLILEEINKQLQRVDSTAPEIKSISDLRRWESVVFYKEPSPIWFEMRSNDNLIKALIWLESCEDNFYSYAKSKEANKSKYAGTPSSLTRFDIAMLVYEQGLSQGEIARMYGVSRQAINHRIKSYIAKISKEMDEE
jgi:hypothetical protein